MVDCLAPHLCGLDFATRYNSYKLQFGLECLLPAAAQLERACIRMNPDNFKVLQRFCMLKELHVSVQHVVQLTAPLPQLHKLGMMFNLDTPLRDFKFQCLFSHAPALRQLELYCEHYTTDRPVPCRCGGSCYCGLNRGDMEVLACLQCQQLDLLTVTTSTIDGDSVKLLARIQCPLKLSVHIETWSGLGSAPLLHCWQGSQT